jgi:uncharacterized protein (TIGR02246 family)
MYVLPASVVSAQSANPEDEQAIGDVLTRFYEGWNTHDVDKMVSAYAEDIDHINVFAEWNKGKSAIREAARQLHAGPAKNDRKTFTIEKIRFMKPDVAVIQVRSLSTGPGSACGGCGNLGTYVMTKDTGQWLVVRLYERGVRAQSEGAEDGDHQEGRELDSHAASERT